MIFLAVLLLLAAVLLMVYPFISNYINDKYQSTVQAEYLGELADKDGAELEAARAAATAYNEGLSPLCFNREGVEAATLCYNELLNLSGNGIMGYVEIPSRNISLPIYHGTSEEVLQRGVGHLIGSSLPVGGEGCHTVLTGHSGVAGKRLFSDIDAMQPGDVFYLQILGDTLAYKVIAVNTVLPHKTELLAPVSGEDLCTLVTCYPYGVNTHRLLVRGSRIPYEKAEEMEQVASKENTPMKSTWQEQYLQGLKLGGGIAACCLVLILTVLFFFKRRRKHREKV